MLYDTTADVIRKAMRGLAMAPSEAAARAGMAEKEVIAASRGPAARGTLEKLAPALGLDPSALAALPGYTPPIQMPPAVTRLDLPFDNETVNAWLVDDGHGRPILFDTGNGRDDARRSLETRGITRVDAIITHPHGDHVGGIEGLGGMVGSLAGPGTPGPLVPGDRLQRGDLVLRVIGLPGHCPGAVGYRIEGLDRPVCVTGDALFAGSIGGCAPGKPYQQALEALRAEVMSLPDDTVLLPGHGPATTVGSERAANPFLADPAAR